MGLSRIGAVRVFDKWALGLCLIPDLPLRRDRAPAAGRSTGAGQNLASVPRGQTGGVLLVGGMNGVVVTLDAALLEVHRFQAHEGAVNVVQYHDQLIWTGGGDGCLRAWSWPEAEEVLCLRGPKKPIVACWHDPVLGVLAQSHERALYRWPLQDGQPAQEPRRIRNVTCLQRLPSAWEHGEAEGQGEVGGQGARQGQVFSWFGAPKTGPKAGDIGALAAFDPATGRFGATLFEDGLAAWSLAPYDETRLLAFGLDRRPWIVDPVAGLRKPIEWHSQSGGPRSLTLSDGGRILYGDGKIVGGGTVQNAPIKGLYGAVEWPEGRVLFAGADGQVWVYAV